MATKPPTRIVNSMIFGKSLWSLCDTEAATLWANTTHPTHGSNCPHQHPGRKRQKKAKKTKHVRNGQNMSKYVENMSKICQNCLNTLNTPWFRTSETFPGIAWGWCLDDGTPGSCAAEVQVLQIFGESSKHRRARPTRKLFAEPGCKNM